MKFIPYVWKYYLKSCNNLIFLHIFDDNQLISEDSIFVLTFHLFYVFFVESIFCFEITIDLNYEERENKIESKNLFFYSYSSEQNHSKISIFQFSDTVLVNDLLSQKSISIIELYKK
jgi:hypothetical protein